VVILSAAGFAGEGALPTAAALTAVGFCGTGLPGGDEVAVVAGGDGAAGGLSSVLSSAGGTVSSTAAGAVLVVSSAVLAPGSDKDCSEVVNDSVDRPAVERSGSPFM